MLDKNNLNKQINFLLYKNKKSNKNHKITGIQFSVLDKPLKRSISSIDKITNIAIKNNLSLGETLTKEGNSKKLIVNQYNIEYFKCKNKTIPKYECFNNRNYKILKNNDNSSVTNNCNHNLNNEIYYKLLCLGRKININNIKGVRSPLLRYFLFNISQRNENHILNIAPSYNNYNNSKIFNNKKNNSNNLKPNFSLIEKKLRVKYDSLNAKNNNNKNNGLPNILEHKYSPIIIKNKTLIGLKTDKDSDQDSSSENNQFNNIIENNYFKKPNNKKVEENKNYINNNNTLNSIKSPFKYINKIRKDKKQKLDFFRFKNSSFKPKTNERNKYILLKNLTKLFSNNN